MKFDSIDDALNTETVIDAKVVDDKSEIVKAQKTKDDIKKDYEYTRGQLYSLIEKGQESLDGIMELAQESSSPRAYEVAGQILKSVADTADKLIDLQKKVKDLDTEAASGPKSVTNNAVFVGSTAELSKFLKNSIKDSDK
jgi:hypothetical protein